MPRTRSLSRDLEVHALSSETARLLRQAQGLVRSLTSHQEVLTSFVVQARQQDEDTLSPLRSGEVA